MRITKCFCRAFAAAVLLASVAASASAGDRCSIIYTNGLDESITYIRVKYSTPYGEPRFDRTRVTIPPGGQYRIGIQGTTLPETMLIDLPAKRYVFRDLSGLNPEQEMRVTIERGDSGPRIRRDDADGAVNGIEREYLTVANRPNAVDKDDVMEIGTYDELMALLRDAIDEAGEKLGEFESVDVEAGPIWNNDDARERCPEIAEAWGEKIGREARWTGHWRTTVPNAMSVCGCVAGTAGEDGTITVEDEGWGETTSFPVFWKEWHGVGYTRLKEATEDGLPIALRFPLPAENVSKMFEEFLSDLRVDGYRPVMFRMETPDRDEEIDFRATGEDKYDAHDRVMELLSAGYAEDKIEATLLWVSEDAYEKAKAGEDVGAVRGVGCSFTSALFEAVFIPDGEQFLEAD